MQRSVDQLFLKRGCGKKRAEGGHVKTSLRRQLGLVLPGLPVQRTAEGLEEERIVVVLEARLWAMETSESSHVHVHVGSLCQLMAGTQLTVPFCHQLSTPGCGFLCVCPAWCFPNSVSL